MEPRRGVNRQFDAEGRIVPLQSVDLQNALYVGSTRLRSTGFRFGPLHWLNDLSLGFESHRTNDHESASSALVRRGDPEWNADQGLYCEGVVYPSPTPALRNPDTAPDLVRYLPNRELRGEHHYDQPRGGNWRNLVLSVLLGAGAFPTSFRQNVLLFSAGVRFAQTVPQYPFTMLVVPTGHVGPISHGMVSWADAGRDPDHTFYRRARLRRRHAIKREGRRRQSVHDSDSDGRSIVVDFEPIEEAHQGHRTLSITGLGADTEDEVSYGWYLSRIAQVCDRFTYYEQLRAAQRDGNFESVREGIISEWKFVGATLLALAAADVTVYGFSGTTISTIDQTAAHFLTLSAISTAFGLCVVAGLLLRYLNTTSDQFADLAYSTIYKTYTFFAISSRLPLLTLCMSVVTFAFFMLIVAFAAWPSAVIMLCLCGVALLGIQYIVRGTTMSIHGLGTVLRVAIATLNGSYAQSSSTHVISARSF